MLANMPPAPDLAAQAQAFAHAAHDAVGHERKYSGEPYWVHTDEVAAMVSRVTDDLEVIAAAHLHDVLEDVAPKDARWNEAAIAAKFGERVCRLVVELTDVFIKETYPGLNRRERRSREIERLAGVSAEAQTVKCADITSNCRDIAHNDPDFGRVYVGEVETLLARMTKADPGMRKKAERAIAEAWRVIRTARS